MNIAGIMSRQVAKVDMDASLGAVKRLFDNGAFHHLLVTDGVRLVGVVSDRDVLKWISPRLDTLAETAKDKNVLRKPVHQIMSRKPMTLSPDDTLETAAERLLAGGVSCLPVVEAGDRLVGIVTWKDLLRYFLACETTGLA
ncbi:CBS domain-containing protein [Thiohalobacter sp. IOR34]|uniref:CBS domain-containing protein n=1 Tax=Thiohalobacter sp. IOR34 TaxID=3057176 RepID=UPI0025B20D10|nr:CBS domain-containing protein [Thiohalobacter sp. IOR34]WJW76212.1 CBS domain-containing protein [Thiohalobacter sp. IOR34]